jgi:hypothetical protein
MYPSRSVIHLLVYGLHGQRENARQVCHPGVLLGIVWYLCTDSRSGVERVLDVEGHNDTLILLFFKKSLRRCIYLSEPARGR